MNTKGRRRRCWRGFASRTGIPWDDNVEDNEQRVLFSEHFGWKISREQNNSKLFTGHCGFRGAREFFEPANRVAAAGVRCQIY